MANKDVNNDKKKNSFGKDLKSEMKKVTWPTLKELVNNTSAVISIVLIVAAIVFVLDVCFENVNQFGVEKLKSAVSSSSEESNNENNEEDVTATVEENSTEPEVQIDGETTDVTTE